MTPQERRTKSIEILKEQGVPYMEQLPMLESEEGITPRSTEEIAKRAIACLITIQVACDAMAGKIEEAREFFRESNFIEAFNVADEFTEAEEIFFSGEPAEQQILDMTWKYEAYWSLIWALGLVEELNYPDNICDCQHAINVVTECKGFDDFMKKVKPRGLNEILDQADLLYRYHWACVDARINGRPAPAGLDPSVVCERRWGFEWLIGKDSDENDYWDNVMLHT
ncbi:MAG: DUF4272 domain-containing protein [Oscillospiraceae bacterium]|nr:DUF4272 domain-containing protein [Oscillospiraceae bacterium]